MAQQLQQRAASHGLGAGNAEQSSAQQSHRSGPAAGQRERSISSSREGRMNSRAASEAPAGRPGSGRPTFQTGSWGAEGSDGSEDEHMAAARHSSIDGTITGSLGSAARQDGAAGDRPGSAPSAGAWAGRLGRRPPGESILAGKAAQVAAKAGMLQAAGGRAVDSPQQGGSAKRAVAGPSRQVDPMTAKLQALSQTYRGMRSKHGRE